MKTQKYESRLPAVRVDETIKQKLEREAEAQNITLAEAHRQALARALNRVGIIGTIGPGGVIRYNRDLPEAA
jgi:hypothetical protein